MPAIRTSSSNLPPHFHSQQKSAFSSPVPSSQATATHLPAVAPKKLPSSLPSSRKPEPIFIRDQKLVPTVVFDTFWRFAAERKAIDDKRRSGIRAPWTADPILREYRFCNTYRVLDRISQYIIRNVIETGPQEPVEVIFRIVLFNTFTKIETYELLQAEVGPLTWETYDRRSYAKVLERAKNEGNTLYTGSFQKPAPQFGHKSAFKNHLVLLEVMMHELPGQLADCSYMADIFEWLVSLPGMGDFTSYQLLLNLSYSSVMKFSENDFVVAGLGAHSGLSKIFGKSMARALGDQPGIEIDIMRWLQKTQAQHFGRLGLEFHGLGPENLPMQLCDIEHTLCEVDKYSRVVHPTIRGLHGRTKLRSQGFKPSADFSAHVYLPKAWSDVERLTARIRPGGIGKITKLYKVDRIADRRKTGKGLVQYLVYWWGYPDEDATWEPEDELIKDVPEMVEDFVNSIKVDGR